MILTIISIIVKMAVHDVNVRKYVQAIMASKSLRSFPGGLLIPNYRPGEHIEIENDAHAVSKHVHVTIFKPVCKDGEGTTIYLCECPIMDPLIANLSRGPFKDRSLNGAQWQPISRSAVARSSSLPLETCTPRVPLRVVQK